MVIAGLSTHPCVNLCCSNHKRREDRSKHFGQQWLCSRKCLSSEKKIEKNSRFENEDFFSDIPRIFPPLFNKSTENQKKNPRFKPRIFAFFRWKTLRCSKNLTNKHNWLLLFVITGYLACSSKDPTLFFSILNYLSLSNYMELNIIQLESNNRYSCEMRITLDWQLRCGWTGWILYLAEPIHQTQLAVSIIASGFELANAATTHDHHVCTIGGHKWRGSTLSPDVHYFIPPPPSRPTREREICHYNRRVYWSIFRLLISNPKCARNKSARGHQMSPKFWWGIGHIHVQINLL